MKIELLKELLNKIDFLESHNKNYTQKQYYNILDIKESLKKELSEIQKQYYKNKYIVNFNSIYFDFALFDNLYNLSDAEFKKLKNKAKKLFIKYTGNYTLFDLENCFISSSSLHGFYFPNLNNKINCISFINKKPYIILMEE